MAHLQRRLQLVSRLTEQEWSDPPLKVAFATSDLRHVDQHFGTAESFAIYQLDRKQSVLLEVTRFGTLAMDGNEEKLAAKITALTGCLAVYSRAIGASAIAQLRARKIQPVKVASVTTINQLLDQLKRELEQGPHGWLKRALTLSRPADSARFDLMEAEGWAE